MAIQWGPTNGHMQVGIDVRTDPYNASTTHINVYVDFWVRTIAWGASDDQAITGYVNGGAVGTWGYRMNSGSGQTTEMVIATHTIPGQGLSYGGGPSYTFGGAVSGSVIGNPSQTIGWTLPARPATVPGQPGTRADSVTSSSARIVVSAPASNGAAIDAYRVRVQRNVDGAIVYDRQTSGTVTVSGLARNTAYVYFAGAHNAKGWGAWSPARAFTTLATVPDRQTSAPVVQTIEPDALRFSWAAPNNGGASITGYDLQVSTSSSFGTADTVSTTATAATATGLSPATTYYARTRAKNSQGAGAWSPVQTVETLSSAKVYVDGQWLQARVWVHNGTTWVPAKVWKHNGTGWVL